MNHDTHLQLFTQQMAGLTSHSQSSSQPGGKRKSVRKIKPYDGESQSLRSFLTAIELQMENDGIVGSENKVKYVGNYVGTSKARHGIGLSQLLENATSFRENIEGHEPRRF